MRIFPLLDGSEFNYNYGIVMALSGVTSMMNSFVFSLKEETNMKNI